MAAVAEQRNREAKQREGLLREGGNTRERRTQNAAEAEAVAMNGEEVAGPAGPKLVRLLYFFGAGCNLLSLSLSLFLYLYLYIYIYMLSAFDGNFSSLNRQLLSVICAVGINKWRDFQRKSLLSQHDQNLQQQQKQP